MNHPKPMGRDKAFHGLTGHGNEVAHGQGSALHRGIERFPIEEFHDHAEIALNVIDIKDRDHIGMLQRGEHRGLLPQVRPHPICLSLLRRQELFNCHIAAQSVIPSLVHGTRPAMSQAF